LVSIDINSGRSTKQHGIEQTAVATNVEAAREIARQLRLRDMAGLVVIDFIDMEYNSNVRKVERAMKDALKNDRARIQVGRISGFGLMEMSRQRLRTGVLEATTRECPHCDGTGLVRTASSAGLSALRLIEDEAAKGKGTIIRLAASTEAAIYLLNSKRDDLVEIEQRYGVSVEVIPEGEDEGAKMAVASAGPRPTERPKFEPIVDDDDDDDLPEEVFGAEEDDYSAAKKNRRRRRGGRGRSKKRREDQVEGEGSEDEAERPGTETDDDGEEKPKKRRRRGGRGRRGKGKSVDEGATENEAAEVGAEAEADTVSDAEIADDAPTEKSKRKRAPRRKKADTEAMADADAPAATEASEAPVEEAKPKKKRAPRKKKAHAESATDEVTSSADEAPAEEEKPKKKRAPRKAKAASESAETRTAEASEQNSTADKADDDGKPKRGWWQRTFGEE
jgi:ribonuclease E